MSGHEDVQVLLLQLAGDAYGVLHRGSGAYDGGETGSRAVDEFHPALADDDVIGCTQPDAVDRVGADQVFAGFDDLEGKQGGDARVQGAAQIRQPEIFAGHRRQQPMALVENLLHVGELVDSLAQERVDDRQGVSGVGKAHGTIDAFGRNGFCQVVFRVAHNLVCAADCRRCDDFAHCSSRLDFMSYILRSFWVLICSASRFFSMCARILSAATTGSGSHSKRPPVMLLISSHRKSCTFLLPSTYRGWPSTTYKPLATK